VGVDELKKHNKRMVEIKEIKTIEREESILPSSPACRCDSYWNHPGVNTE
jgi:hypothetical protein